METHAPSGLQRFSLSDRIRACAQRPERSYRLAQLLWNELFALLPQLPYVTEGSVEIEHGVMAKVSGHPDPCTALETHLLIQGLPECYAAARLARPTFWFATTHGVLVPQTAQENGRYLWVFNHEQHAAASKCLGEGLKSYAPYLVSNLVRMRTSKTYK